MAPIGLPRCQEPSVATSTWVDLRRQPGRGTSGGWRGKEHRARGRGVLINARPCPNCGGLCEGTPGVLEAEVKALRQEVNELRETPAQGPPCTCDRCIEKRIARKHGEVGAFTITTPLNSETSWNVGGSGSVAVEGKSGCVSCPKDAELT